MQIAVDCVPQFPPIHLTLIHLWQESPARTYCQEHQTDCSCFFVACLQDFEESDADLEEEIALMKVDLKLAPLKAEVEIAQLRLKAAKDVAGLEFKLRGAERQLKAKRKRPEEQQLLLTAQAPDSSEVGEAGGQHRRGSFGQKLHFFM